MNGIKGYISIREASCRWGAPFWALMGDPRKRGEAD